MTLKENIAEAAQFLEERFAGRKPAVGIILGSGLGPFADEIEDPIAVDFKDVPHMRSSTANGHKGRFVCGTVSGVCVVAMQGRLHGYEGYSAVDVAFPVWVMHAIGARVLITTNAAGAVNETYHVGDFCIMSDHINLIGRNPIEGQDPNEIATRFVSMYECYDPDLRALAHEVAERAGIPVREGVYLGVLGPTFETPAEIRAFRTLGADTVAMSVCEETIAARHVGMRVLGISLVSNMGCGIESASPSDDEVFEVAQVVGPRFCTLVAGVVARLGA